MKEKQDDECLMKLLEKVNETTNADSKWLYITMIVLVGCFAAIIFTLIFAT